MQTDLTEKQERVLRFIARKIWQEKKPPTIREIGQNFKFSSTGTVRDYLDALQKKGYIRLAKKKSRAVELIGAKLLRIPIVAQVYAGGPTLTYEDIEGYVNLEQLLAQRDAQVFALRVQGNSMVEAGIMPQDLVLVRKQPSCQNGDIVVARLGEETTIKYFNRRDNKVYLEPANKNYAPVLAEENLFIIGKVISVIRRYV